MHLQFVNMSSTSSLVYDSLKHIDIPVASAANTNILPSRRHNTFASPSPTSTLLLCPLEPNTSHLLHYLRTFSQPAGTGSASRTSSLGSPLLSLALAPLV
jgi:hypothetical protein